MRCSPVNGLWGRVDPVPKGKSLIYQPKSNLPVPVFLGYNFGGNQTVHADTNILITTSWVENDSELGINDHHANEKTRGIANSRWPVEMIVQHGFALASVYYGDIDPDFVFAAAIVNDRLAAETFVCGIEDFDRLGKRGFPID